MDRTSTDSSDIGPVSGRTDASRYLGMLKRWWWLISAATLIAGLSAYFVTQSIAPRYRATATLLIVQTQEPGTLAYNDVLTSERLTQTYRELVTTRPVLQAAVDAGADRDLTVEDLASKISASVVANTQLVRVSVTDADPERAAELANLVVTVFDRESAIDGPAGAGVARVAESAAPPQAAEYPNLQLNLALAVVAGLIMAAGLVLFLEYLDDTMKSSADVQAASGLATLGEVRRWHASDGGAVRSFGEEAEAYSLLRTNVQFATLSHPARVVLVTSANPKEGKSTTAANFALAMADAGKRVTLVDVDLRRPALHQKFGMDNGQGLTSALLQGAAFDEGVLRPTGHPRLSLVTSGPLPPNPAELLGWQGFDSLLERLRGTADIVVLDSPPVLAVADARILAVKADATIIVVHAGVTRAAVLQQSLDALSRAKANVIGVVLNKVNRRRRDYGYYYRAAASGQPRPRRTVLGRARKSQPTESGSQQRAPLGRTLPGESPARQRESAA